MITEDQIEQLAIQWFQDTGWSYVNGTVISPEGEAPEREDFRAVVLKGRLAEAVRRLNPKLPPEAVAEVAEVVHVVTKPEHSSLVQNNRAFHRYLMDGVLVEFTNAKGEKEADYAQLVDFTWASRNDFLVVNQFTITGTKKPRRPDLVCFVNGLPLGLIEPKNPADQQADVWKAFEQLQTYQAEISDLLVFNEALVVSDGMNARVGSLTASKEWFMPWPDTPIEKADVNTQETFGGYVSIYDIKDAKEDKAKVPIKLRPEWAGTKLTKEGKETGWNPEDGALRIVMTGTASDRAGLQDHVFSKGQKKRMATRFKDAKDPLKLVIVRATT